MSHLVYNKYMSDETTLNSPLPQTLDPTDSAPIAMPSEAPEASGNVVTPLPVKDIILMRSGSKIISSIQM